jgi:hypothetical protein
MKTIFQFLFLIITISLSAQQPATNSKVIKKALEDKG